MLATSIASADFLIDADNESEAQASYLPAKARAR